MFVQTKQLNNHKTKQTDWLTVKIVVFCCSSFTGNNGSRCETVSWTEGSKVKKKLKTWTSKNLLCLLHLGDSFSSFLCTSQWVTINPIISCFNRKYIWLMMCRPLNSLIVFNYRQCLSLEITSRFSYIWKRRTVQSRLEAAADLKPAVSLFF